MCQESLINYLSNETGIFYDDIEIFIKYGEIIKDSDMNTYKKESYKMPRVIVDNFETIDKALEINPELKKSYESDERVKNLIDIAKKNI